MRKLYTCWKEVALGQEYAARLRKARKGDADKKMYIPVGCSACEMTGYKGRLGIYEMLFLDDQIRNALRTNKGEEEIRSLARSAGMRLMRDEAIEKARMGETSIEEVFRVVPQSRTTNQCECCGAGLTLQFLYCPVCGAARPEGAAERVDDPAVETAEQPSGNV